MKVWRITALFLLLSLLPLALPAAATAQDNPESLLRALIAAVEAGDVEAELALYAEDVTQTFVFGTESETLVGKEAARQSLEEPSEDEPADQRIELLDVQVSGDRATGRGTLYASDFAQLGLEPAPFTVIVVVRDGLIAELTVTFDPEWAARAEAAFAAAEGQQTTPPAPQAQQPNPQVPAVQVPTKS